MIGGDGGGDCGGGDSIGGGGSGSGDAAAGGHSMQPNPIDERPRINGAPVTDNSHELVIKKQNAQN